MQPSIQRLINFYNQIPYPPIDSQNNGHNNLPKNISSNFENEVRILLLQNKHIPMCVAKSIINIIVIIKIQF